MDMTHGFPIFGTPDEGAVRQMQECLNPSTGAVKGALMADHHLGYSMPIGGVIAYKDAISPSGVGYDIGCGNKAVMLDMVLDEIPVSGDEYDMHYIMDDIIDAVSFGVGRNRKTPDVPGDNSLWEHPAWQLPMVKPLRQMAEKQLGTVGSGNHFVDVFADQDNMIWVGVHFGSRGLGHKIATYFIKQGGGSDQMDAPPVMLDVNSYLGEDYLMAMDLAGKYAYAGRDFVCDEVSRIFGADQLSSVHNHHNFARKEFVDFEELWVVRKGATLNVPGQRSFIGGSMAEDSVIVEGQHTPNADLTINSTIHGAGRVMGRREAAGKTKWIKLKRLAEDPNVNHLIDKITNKQSMELSAYCLGEMDNKRIQINMRDGKITRAMMNESLQDAGVVLRGGGTDESPHCYKNLPDVIADQGKSIRVIHTLRPLGVAMAGEDFDPYKD